MKNKSTFIHGFTLMELMVTLAVMGGVLSIAAPSLQSMMSNNRLTTQANSLVGALNIARSESVKRNQSVVVQKENAGTTWADGWFVWVSDASIGKPTIRKQAAITSNSINFKFLYNRNFITYKPDGTADNNGSFFICSPASEAKFRRIIIARAGRVRTTNQETDPEGGGRYGTDCG
jgi:type IV fimbrial biogenesis protein FimT